MKTSTLIISYLESLSESDKAILILRWAHEFTFEEIESIVGIEKDEIMFRHKVLMLNLKQYISAGDSNGESSQITKAKKE